MMKLVNLQVITFCFKIIILHQVFKFLLVSKENQKLKVVNPSAKLAKKRGHPRKNEKPVKCDNKNENNNSHQIRQNTLRFTLCTYTRFALVEIRSFDCNTFWQTFSRFGHVIRSYFS